MTWLTVDQEDSTNWEKWARIPFVLQLPTQDQALQVVRKAGDRGALVEDTLSRMALGPWQERPLPGNCPATSQGRKGSEKRRFFFTSGAKGG